MPPSLGEPGQVTKPSAGPCRGPQKHPLGHSAGAHQGPPIWEGRGGESKFGETKLTWQQEGWQQLWLSPWGQMPAEGSCCSWMELRGERTELRAGWMLSKAPIFGDLLIPRGLALNAWHSMSSSKTPYACPKEPEVRLVHTRVLLLWWPQPRGSHLSPGLLAGGRREGLGSPHQDADPGAEQSLQNNQHEAQQTQAGRCSRQGNDTSVAEVGSRGTEKEGNRL